MNMTIRSTAAGITVAALLGGGAAFAGAQMDGSPAKSRVTAHKNIVITNPWIRVVPPGSANTAAYMRIRSVGVADTLLKASVPSSFAKMTELHLSMMDPATGQMKMVQQKSIAIPRNATRQLRMGSYHLMIMGLVNGVTAGQKVPVTLVFKKAGTVRVTAPAMEM